MSSCASTATHNEPLHSELAFFDGMDDVLGG